MRPDPSPVGRWYHRGDSCDLCGATVLYRDGVPGQAQYRLCPHCGALWAWVPVAGPPDDNLPRSRGARIRSARQPTHVWQLLRGTSIDPEKAARQDRQQVRYEHYMAEEPGR